MNLESLNSFTLLYKGSKKEGEKNNKHGNVFSFYSVLLSEMTTWGAGSGVYISGVKSFDWKKKPWIGFQQAEKSIVFYKAYFSVRAIAH